MSKDWRPNRTVDCIGLYCPMPILKIRETLNKMDIGQVVELVADDPSSEEDIKYFTKTTGQELLKIEKEGEQIRFLIKKVK